MRIARSLRSHDATRDHARSLQLEDGLHLKDAQAGNYDQFSQSWNAQRILTELETMGIFLPWGKDSPFGSTPKTKAGARGWRISYWANTMCRVSRHRQPAVKSAELDFST